MNTPEAQCRHWRDQIPEAGVAAITHLAIWTVGARVALSEEEGEFHCDLDYPDDQAVLLDLALATEIIIWPPSLAGSAQCRDGSAHPARR